MTGSVYPSTELPGFESDKTTACEVEEFSSAKFIDFVRPGGLDFLPSAPLTRTMTGAGLVPGLSLPRRGEAKPSRFPRESGRGLAPSPTSSHL